MLQDYSAMKIALGGITGMSENLIHVHVGLGIFVLTALLLRRRMRSPIPLATVAFLAIANEVADFTSGEPWGLHHSLLDIVNTLLWPAVLFLLARRGRQGRDHRVESEAKAA